MVQSSTVSSDANKFSGFVTDIPQKFAELKSSWQGHSFNELSEKVTTLAGEIKIVNDQMAVLQKICEWHEAYCKAVGKYELHKNAYDSYIEQKRDEEDEDAIRELESFIFQESREMEEAEAEMNRCVLEARSQSSKFKKDTIKEVTFQSIGISV